MDLPEIAAWLAQNTLFETLSTEALQAIASALHIEQVKENRRLGLEDTPPTALYVLKSGHLESYRTSANSAAQAISWLPGAVLYLKELLLHQPAEQTLITLTDCELWTIERDRLDEIVQQYPEISRNFSQQLAAELSQVESQLAFEQERQIVLRPYVVPKVRRGVIGSSRYAVRLRQDIKKATGDRQPVLIFGEPGLEKDNIAALIHFGSGDRKQPMIKVNCDTLQVSGADLFGREGGKPGLIEALGEGTLLLNNVQDFPKALWDKLVHLLETGEYTRIGREGQPSPQPQRSQARIIMNSERKIPALEHCPRLRVIRVPPLRVRKADIEAQVNYYISLFCRAKGLHRPTISPEALRRLQGYDFPGNLSELESMVERAILQSDCASVLTEEIFWVSEPKGRRFRVNLLNAYPQLWRFLRSPWYPDRINYGVTLTAFALVVALLIFGPQSRDRNIALNLFWAWWWPLILIAFPFLGRIWCAFCPFMIYGEVTQWLSLKLFPGQLRPWPRQQADRWGGWFMFGLFALILLWEELWNLENTAYLSACLLLLITAGAMIFSALFERRFWCRYLCPIGGMNGLFAKLAIIELRAQQGICAASCTTYQCYKGGPQKGDGMETGGCPVYSHPAQLTDNRNCVLCMTCLKACPHRSVELNLRPPGIELWTTHQATSYEVALLLLLFGAVFLHRIPEGLEQLGFVPRSLLSQFGIHTGLSLIALVIPALVVLAAYGLIRLVNQSLKPRSFVELAYGYLPLVLGCNLAHYLDLGLNEMGRVLPVTLATFGFTGEGLPVIVTDPAVILFLQGVTLLGTAFLSVVLTQKIARQPLRNMLPQHGAIALLTLGVWQVVLG
ncbi:MAG: sigma 54-interacting transcriptional regulator [Synechococcales cyanobacterium T60_A2020_003]|nr:sigma 54-interacting transcriptional regulator [Synechococcales cyanobacterium T60_A2020_003]